MDKRNFLYFLTNAQGQFHVWQNGVLNTIPAQTPIQFAPSGWKDQMLKYSRNTTYWGLVPNYTIPLRFVKDGAAILRSILYNNSYEEVCYLLIYKLNNLTGKHEGYFMGEIDFSKYTDSKDYFEVSCTETGFYKQLKAYENTAVEIPMLQSNTAEVLFNGLELQKKYSFAIVEGYEWAGIHTLGCAYVNEEGTSFGIVTGNSPLDAVPGFDQATNDDRWLLKNVGTSETLFTVKGKVIFTVNSLQQTVKIYLSTNTFRDFILVPQQLYAIGKHEIDVNININLLPTERLFIFCQKTQISNITEIGLQYETTNLYFTFLSKYKPSYVKFFKAISLANAIVQKAFGSQYNVVSPLLAACNLYLSCGDALRGLDNPVMKSSFKDFFTSMYRNLGGIAMYIQGNTIHIVPLQQVLNTANKYHLGDVKECTFSLREDMLGSILKIGYPNQDYDDVNGRDEFNNTHVYKTSITRVTKGLDLTAKYRADPYGMEFMRINLDGKTTTDNKSDTDVFIADIIEANGLFSLNRPAYSSISGIINTDSIFNTTLSPKNLVLKHGNYLASILFQLQNKQLTFQTTEKNQTLSTVLNGVTITENANVNINTLGTPFFIPHEVKFKLQVPASLLSLMRFPYTCFTFTYRGNTYEGFVLDASQKPSGNEEQEWTLLLSANNNIQNLIHE